jgi:hypothetical protein
MHEENAQDKDAVKSIGAIGRRGSAIVHGSIDV